MLKTRKNIHYTIAFSLSCELQTSKDQKQNANLTTYKS